MTPIAETRTPRDAALDRYVERVLAAWPPVTDHQRATAARILAAAPPQEDQRRQAA